MLDFSVWDDGFDALSRHLPWDCLVAPDVVLLAEDAALLAVVEYRGPDPGTAGVEAQARAAAGVATILQAFTGGWCLHFELQRRWAADYPPSTGPHAASLLIDAERRDRLGAARAGLESRTFIAITWTPATAPVRRTVAWFTRGDPGRQVADVYRDHVEPFRRLVEQFASLLGRVLGTAWVLTREALLGFLHACVSPRPLDRVAVPLVPGFPIPACLTDTGFVPGSFPCWTNGTA
ncbi:hypothetical protein [Oleisolibacter albus]|uniref:hypothetical protein n=1 Tax=Oleisolibacter albus TaxID=2171757 RepID=UPI000DF47743|nr:hypothetical protein [Oleisolibacter albus]